MLNNLCDNYLDLDCFVVYNWTELVNKIRINMSDKYMGIEMEIDVEEMEQDNEEMMDIDGGDDLYDFDGDVDGLDYYCYAFFYIFYFV